MRKSIFILLAALIVITSVPGIPVPIPNGGGAQPPRLSRRPPGAGRPDFSAWFIEDGDSRWTAPERARVEEVLANTLEALAWLGDAEAELLSGYRFRRFAGQFARNRDGKIALVDHAVHEVILSDTILQPGNEFFIYHELGHIIDHRSSRALNERFHALTLETEGATTLHEWTTAQGFFLRGQAHIRHTEATADAFALWVWVEFAGQPIPHFHDTPDNADPEEILDVFEQALEILYAHQ